MHGVHRAAGCVRGDRGEQRAVGRAEADVLSFHVAALRVGADEGGGEEEQGHGPEHRPPVPRLARHHPERDRQAGGDGEDEEHLEQIRKRSGILERMRAVGIEKTAAIRAKFLDDLLGCDWSLRNHLIRYRIHHRLATRVDDRLAVCISSLNLKGFDQFHGVIGPEILNHALRNKDQCADDAKR